MHSNLPLLLGCLAGCIIPASSGSTHVADPPGGDSNSEVISITSEILQQMNLPQHPEKMTRFDVRLAEGREIATCRIRFADQNSALAQSGCSLIRNRVNWEPPRNRSGRVKKRPTKIWLSWPTPDAEAQMSDFGGALPVSIGAWRKKTEFAPLRKYRVFKGEFTTLLNISDKGVVTDCTIEPDSLPQNLGKIICAQFVDHSRWIPAVDENGRDSATTARIASRLEIDPGDCLEGLGLVYLRKTGVLRWSIATGNDSCRFDAEQFGFPRR